MHHFFAMALRPLPNWVFGLLATFLFALLIVSPTLVLALIDLMGGANEVPTPVVMLILPYYMILGVMMSGVGEERRRRLELTQPT